jgi:CelD/BcsL family acetyltransferase involved in cellulose biosynthesis
VTGVTLRRCDLAGFGEITPEWERLAAGGGSPFLSAAWVESWWRAVAPDEASALVLQDEDGSLLAGALFVESGRTLRAAVNDHTPDWGAVAADDNSGSRFWAEVAGRAGRRVVLGPLLGEGEEVAAPREALESAGYRLVEEGREPSPLLELPGSFEELFAARSGKLRAQIRRGRRGLEELGELETRTVDGGPGLEEALDAFFALEAAGWKGQEGTAIASDPALLELYRGFAESASAQGRLRIQLLELNGKLVAADYGCVFEGCGYRIKTTFDEGLRKFAPGMVLLTDVLEASIEEGLTRYDFLGGPDEYKLRWTDRVRGHTTIHGFRGPGAVPAYQWRNRVRPALKTARDRLRRAGR